MAKAILKYKSQVENLESRNSVNMSSYICPHSLEQLRNEKDYDDHKNTHLMKINTKFLKCDLLKYIPYSWSTTKKRTNHAQLSNIEHHVAYASGENHIEEKHNLLDDEGKDLLVISVNDLPIKKRKIKEMNDDVQEESQNGIGLEQIEVSRSEEKYICSICPKSFKSYQALGGHIAHHGLRKLHESTKFEHIHKCCNCNKIFPKGQALGGHKRHCNKGKIISSNPPEHITLLNLDLNDPPPNEDEDEDEDGAQNTCSYTN